MKKELWYINKHSNFMVWKYIPECDMDLIKANLINIPVNTLTERSVNLDYFNLRK